MSWYAIECVEAAGATVRQFLLPFRPAAWGKLAVVALFLSLPGGTTGAVSTTGSLTSGLVGGWTTEAIGPGRSLDEAIEAGAIEAGVVPEEAADSDPLGVGADGGPMTFEELLEAIAGELAAIDFGALVGVFLLLTLFSIGVAVVVETFRFVLYDAIRRNGVRLLGPFGGRLPQAIRLVGFKLGLLGLYVAPVLVVGWVALGTESVLPGAGMPGGAIGVSLLSAYTAIGGLVVLLCVRFTNEFVVPIMTLTDSSVVGGWRRFWPTLRSEWPQFTAYLIVHFLLLAVIRVAQSIVVSLVVGVVVATAALVAIIVVFGIVGGIEATLESIVALAGLGTVGVLAAVAIVLLLLPVRVLVVSYVATYELSVLRSAEDEFDLLDAVERSANADQ